MYELARFGFNDLMDCRRRLRALLDDEPETTEEMAERIVRFLHEELVDADGRPACALVRLFKTHPYADLDDELQAFARGIAPGADSIADLRCLVLVATAGDLPEWCSRHSSRGHRAIPLTSEKMVEEAPMISQLIRQMGLRIADVIQPRRSLLLDDDTNYSVFYVPVAKGSPYIVAQDEFVIPHGIESVIGFGGMLASGDLFAAILFSKIAIPAEVAESFRIIGLNLKLSMLTAMRKPLFRAASPAGPPSS